MTAEQPGRIVEHAILAIKPGRESEFEAAFETAKHLISRMPGFRGSPDYQEWRALIHDFYEPFPLVEHFEDVARVS